MIRNHIEASLKEEGSRNNGQGIGGGPAENDVVNGVGDRHFLPIQLIRNDKLEKKGLNLGEKKSKLTFTFTIGKRWKPTGRRRRHPPIPSLSQLFHS